MAVLGISGGAGFCGSKIVSTALQKGIKVISFQRRAEKKSEFLTRKFSLENVSQMDVSLLQGIDTFVHSAALVHKRERSDLYQSLNYSATKLLFEKCAAAGVKKFVFLSTVGVYGLTSAFGSVNVKSEVSPKTPYARAKLDAEKYLIESSLVHDVEVLILRLPLVYGKEAPGNLALLKKITNCGIPLPFKDIDNKRSIISVETLANIVTDYVLGKVKWKGIELIVDPQPVSTESIILQLSANRSRPVFLFSVPSKIAKLIFSLAGNRMLYDKLFEDLVFESSQDVSDFIETGLE